MSTFEVPSPSSISFLYFLKWWQSFMGYLTAVPLFESKPDLIWPHQSVEVPVVALHLLKQ